MKISIDKSRFALALLSLGALIILVVVGVMLVRQSHSGTMIKIKLHAVPVNPISMSTPTATPTAELKLNPTKGIVK